MLSQCGGTEEIMFQGELLGQHGPSLLKEAWFRESSLLFSFRHECKTKVEFLHLLQICHFLASGKCCLQKFLSLETGSVINYGISNKERMLGDLVVVLKSRIFQVDHLEFESFTLPSNGIS